MLRCGPATNGPGIYFNNDVYPFGKKEVRQALSYSLNRAGFIKSAFFGVSEPIVTPLWNPNVLGYKADIAMFDPATVGSDRLARAVFDLPGGARRQKPRRASWSRTTCCCRRAQFRCRRACPWPASAR